MRTLVYADAPKPARAAKKEQAATPNKEWVPAAPIRIGQAAVAAAAVAVVAAIPATMGTTAEIAV